jgi:transposase
VAIDLHRRRSVVMHTDADGVELGWQRLANEPEALVAEVLRHGEAPEVAIEATYGWYWAVDALMEAGCSVHLAAPARVRAFENRRVKSDTADCRVLTDLLRTDRVPEAWIAPPAVRELRELVRYRAKLVGLRSSLKAQIHAVLAKVGIPVLPHASSVFETATGRRWLRELVNEHPGLVGAYGQRIESSLAVIQSINNEIDELAATVEHRLSNDERFRAIVKIDGVGPVLAAVFIAEIGDVTRFPSPRHLASWSGLTPRHRESDTKVSRGHITKCGSRLVRWAAIEAAHRSKAGPLHDWRQQLAARRGVKHIATVACARKIIHLVYWGMRDGNIRCLEAAQ